MSFLSRKGNLGGFSRFQSGTKKQAKFQTEVKQEYKFKISEEKQGEKNQQVVQQK